MATMDAFTRVRRFNSFTGTRESQWRKYEHIRVRDSGQGVALNVATFVDLLNKSSAVVDKSEFIISILDLDGKGANSPHNSITSPRRTGKTLLMATERFFLEKPLAEFIDSKFCEWVNGLKVSIQKYKATAKDEQSKNLLDLMEFACAEVRMVGARLAEVREEDGKRTEEAIDQIEAMRTKMRHSPLQDKALDDTIALLNKCFEWQFEPVGNSTEPERQRYKRKRDPRERLFEKMGGFRVTKNREYVQDHCGKYPVVSLSFLGVTGHNYADVKRALAQAISIEFKRHDYLIYELQSQGESHLLERYLKHCKGPFGDLDYHDITSSIQFLCQLLQETLGKKPILFIDEYDTPITSLLSRSVSDGSPDGASGVPAKVPKMGGSSSVTPGKEESGGGIDDDGFKQFKSLYDDLITASVKDNPYLSYSLFAGVLPIGLDGISSHSIAQHRLDRNPFAKYLMISEEEFNELAHHFRVDAPHMKEAKRMYDGYVVNTREGYQRFYNTASAINFLNDYAAGTYREGTVYFRQGGTINSFENLFNSAAFALTVVHLVQERQSGGEADDEDEEEGNEQSGGEDDGEEEGNEQSGGEDDGEEEGNEQSGGGDDDEDERNEQSGEASGDEGEDGDEESSTQGVLVNTSPLTLNDFKTLRNAEKKPLSDVNAGDVELLMRLLFHTGYVSIANTENIVSHDGQCYVDVPNEEMRRELRQKMQKSLMGISGDRPMSFVKSVRHLLCKSRGTSLRRMTGDCEITGTALFDSIRRAYPPSVKFNEPVFEFFLHSTFEADPDLYIRTQVQPKDSEERCDVFLWDRVTDHAAVWELKAKRGKSATILKKAKKQCRDKYLGVFDVMAEELRNKGKRLSPEPFKLRTFIAANLREGKTLTMELDPVEEE